MTRTRAQLLVAVAATVVLAGCGSSGGSSSSGSSSAGSETIGTASGSGGTYLTGAAGRAVYLFDADTNGTSACTGACTAAWPPVLTDGAAGASGSAKSADLATIRRPDGSTQLTYQGHPLYYYAADTKAGQTNGQGSTAFGASWWLVTPDGVALHTASPGSGGSTGPSTGGYGY